MYCNIYYIRFKQTYNSLCFELFFRLCFSREAKASHSFMVYMGVRTCSHKTIYTIKELPKARKA